jgi:hypothetical protein
MASAYACLRDCGLRLTSSAHHWLLLIMPLRPVNRRKERSLEILKMYACLEVNGVYVAMQATREGYCDPGWTLGQDPLNMDKHC